ncbi:hypothetical protein HHI36_020836 [Cryptolaemus montrouzieri]|uniref:C2H2-type domain-containing protein n=1 Tax=Cryptolaemus montrouzieri TaxID=559131 RepID=A0ABD2ND43_9CUCU
MDSNDDKTFVRQFIKAKTETLEANEILTEQLENSFKIDFTKVKTEETEDCDSNKSIYEEVDSTEDSKIFLEGFIEEDRKIWDRDSFANFEVSRTVKTDNDEHEAKLLEQSDDLIDEKCQKDETNLEDSVKPEKIEEDVSTNQTEIYEDKKSTSHVEIKDFSSIKKHKCHICDYRSSRKSIIKQHVDSVHLNLKNYQCSHCDFRTSRKGSLLFHMNGVHLGLKNHKCSQCDYQTAEKGNLTKHIKRVHLGIKNYKCNQCDYQETHESNIKVHIRNVHLGDKNYKCDHCDFQASHKKNLKVHIENVHLSICQECDQCDYQATSKRNLKLHIESVHVGLNLYKCSHCDYQSTHKGTLRII